MAEDVKIKGTDKPIQSSELFTLESLQLIQIRDFDHSVQAIHLQIQFKRFIHFRISTSLVMILKSVDGWNQACQNSETVQFLWYDWQVWNQISYCESFDSDQDFGAWISNICFKIRTFERVCEFFYSDRKFAAGSHIILWIDWFTIHAPKSYSEMMVWESLFRLLFRSVDHESFDSDQNFGVGWMFYDPRSVVPIWNDMVRESLVRSRLQSAYRWFYFFIINQYKTSNH